MGTVLVFILSVWFMGCRDSTPYSPSEKISPFSFASLENPLPDYRPWVRWWWPGGDVNDDELAREVTLLADSYFGGAEIQPFDAALNPDVPQAELERRLSFDTDSFYKHLELVMEEALRQGIAIDLNIGSGWPTGGMHIAAEDSLKTVLWSEHAVKGPGLTTLTLEGPDLPVFYLIAIFSDLLLDEQLARYQGKLAQMVGVIAARVTGGSRSGNPLDLNDHVDLDPDSVHILTDLVNAEGSLTWDVPAGDWRVITLYQAPDGEYPLLNAQPEPGFVLDHFDDPSRDRSCGSSSRTSRPSRLALESSPGSGSEGSVR